MEVCVCGCCLLMLPTATFVGGGFIVGLAEAVYTPTMGLTWAFSPVTPATSFIVGRTFLFSSNCHTEYHNFSKQNFKMNK